MSFLTGNISGHYTLEDLMHQFKVTSTFPYGRDITITSLTDDTAAASPGCLYLGHGDGDIQAEIRNAQAQGAYCILFPGSVSKVISQKELQSAATVPVLFGDLNQFDSGRLAYMLAGRPTDTLATFGVVGSQATYASDSLAQLLHLLGNPIGVIDSRRSFSLERELTCTYPLNPIDTEMILSQMLEDGVNTVVLTINDRTFKRGALSQVGLDVCGRTQSRTMADPLPDTDRVGESGEAVQDDGTAEQETAGIQDGNTDTGTAAGPSSDGTGAAAVQGVGTGSPQASKRTWSRWIPSYRRSGDNPEIGALKPQLRRSVKDFGAIINDDTHCVAPTDAARQVVQSIVETADIRHEYELYLAAAMAMSAGVRKNNVRSALLLAQEINRRQEGNS